MKKNLLNDLSLVHFVKRCLFFAVLFLTVNVWGQTTYTGSLSTSSAQFSTSPQSITLSSVSWTLTNNGGNYSYDATKGQQIGSAGSPASSMSFSTNGISGVISSVKITTSGAASVNATVGVTVGGSSYGGAAQPITASSTEYTFSGSAFGAISINWTQTSSKALYIKQVTVIYSNGITSTKSGNWSDGSTWVGGIVPTSADNVTIAAGHTVTITNASGATITRDNGTLTTISSTATLATNIGYINSGSTASPATTGATTRINGTFQLNSGGYATGNGFVYDTTAGTLVFNTNGVYGVNDSDPYWPGTNGPVNVTLMRTDTGGGTAGFQLNSANRTIPTGGTLSVSGNNSSNAGVFLNNSTLTINGKAQVKPFGYFSNTPVYGNGSTLEYNGVGSYNVGNEWTGNSTAAGAGVPQNVSLVSSSINTPNSKRGLAGNLTVDANSTFNTYEDVFLGGNWVDNGTYNHNNKAAYFNGTASTPAQSITKSGGETFAFLVNSKTAGTLSFGTNITLSGSGGDVLQLIGAGATDLNGKTLTFTGANSNIKVANGSKTITSGITGAIINFNANTNVITDNASNTLTIGNSSNTGYITTNVNAATVNFGTGGLTTILGNLYMTNAGSSVSNGPKYGTSSKLIYNSGSNPFGRTAEWSSSVAGQAGYPQEVQITTNTTLNYPNTGGSAFSTNLGIAGNLTIDAGSSLYMDYGGGANKSGSLTVGKNVLANGNLSLGNAGGGDLYVGGDWTKGAGTFTPNSRQVTFNGSTDQKFTGNTIFDYLKLNKSSGSVLVQGTTTSIGVNKNLDFTKGVIDLRLNQSSTNNITLSHDATISNIGASGNGYAYVSSNGGQVIRTAMAPNETFTFPIGFNSGGTAYAPMTVTNTGGSTSNIGVGGKTSIDNSIADSNSTVGIQWNVTSSVSTTATLAPSWYSDVDKGVSSVTNGQLGNYVSAYTLYPATISPSYSATASNVALSTSGNKIVVGKNEAIVLGNNTCAKAYSVTIDAAAIGGTTVGAVSEGTGVPTCSVINTGVQRDVWYTFTVPVSADGNYKIDVTNSLNDVVELRSGSCTGTVVKCSATSGGVASVTAYLTAGTYYYRVLNDGSSDGTFTTSVSTSPTIMVDQTSLDFGTVAAASAQVKTFNVSGSFLKNASNNITITAPNSGNEYQVSLDGSVWSTSVNVPYTTATLAATQVFVKFRTDNACGAATGNIIFSAPSATVTPTIAITGTTTVAAPLAKEETDNTATSFTAHWDAVAGATGYELDVSTSPTFGTYGSGSVSESFDNANFNTNYYTTATDVALGSGTWNMYQVFKTTTNYNSSPAGVQMKAGQGIIITPAIDYISSISFVAKRTGTTGNKINVYKIVNGTETLLQQLDDKSGFTNYNIPVNETHTAVKIKITSASNTIYLDDVKIDSNINIPSYVSGYNSLAVVGTSQVVKGLTPNTTYYYRVRAVSNACKSGNSVTITAATNNSVIWNSNAWSNDNAGPTATLDAIVRDAYSTASKGSFTAKNLTVENTGKVTIGSGDYVKVEGTLTINNNVAKDNFVILTGGNLLQTSTDANAANGIIQAQRSVTGINNDLSTAMDYVYWSSPVSGQATTGSTGFSPGTPANRFFEYNEAKDNFKATTDGTFTAGKGYAVRAETGTNPDTNANYIDGYSKAYKFNGVPNNGDISIVLKRTQAATADTGVGLGFNLVGNPYPSNIDFKELYSANSNVIYNTAYFWTNNVFVKVQAGTGYGQNNYAVYNGTGGNSATSPQAAGGAGDTTLPDGTVSVGQGFIVQARSQGSSSLSFKNSYSTDHDLRIATNAHFFQKQSSEVKSRFWIKLISPNNLVNTQLIGYVAGASNGFDPDYDAETFSTSSDIFYSVLGARQLLIQGRSENFDTNDVVPLGSNFYQNGTYTIGLSKAEGIFGNGQKIFLKDKLLGKVVDLSQGDYNFEASKGLDNTRFEIVYKDNGVLGTAASEKSEFRVYRDGDYFVIKSSRNLGNVDLYDASGRLVKSYDAKDKMIRIDMNRQNNGVYILKVQNSGDYKTKKIIK